MLIGTYIGNFQGVEQKLDIRTVNESQKTLAGKLTEQGKEHDISGLYKFVNNRFIVEFSINKPEDYAGSWQLLSDQAVETLQGLNSRVSSKDDIAYWEASFKKLNG